MIAGESYRDAVGVCAHEMGDPQLALFLCHLLEGPQGPLQRELLTRDLLPGELHTSLGLSTPNNSAHLPPQSSGNKMRDSLGIQFRAFLGLYYLDSSSTWVSDHSAVRLQCFWCRCSGSWG